MNNVRLIHPGDQDECSPKNPEKRNLDRIEGNIPIQSSNVKYILLLLFPLF